jgi:hypothetical protein
MRRILAPVLSALLATALPLAAQDRPNLMIVFDGSGSMWGQVGGRAKIELARQALSSVLSEVSPDMEIGMLAYGHRVRGQCSDIELIVPMGPAGQTVPRIIAAANGMNPRGMTPLSDAVLIAAQRMGHTEQAATVVLLTDGIETCGGDPCALGRLLAREGVDFRAHVVGFDLTDAEQRQVSCLAEETGGMFLAASDADELQAALARTIGFDPEPMPEPEPEPEPVATLRDITLILRDVAGGPVLTGRPFRSVEFQPLDEGAPPAGRIDLNLNPGPATGRAALLPGSYRMLAVRQTDGREGIRISLPVEIPPGEGPHTVDLVIAARLQLNAFLHPGLPAPDRNGRVPSFSGPGWVLFQIHPIVGDAIDASVDYGGLNSRDVALPPGEYFIRGTLSETFTREMLVTVEPGVTTTVDFDFAAAPVSVDLRDLQGFPVDRVRVEVFDLDAAEPFATGRGRERTALLPAWLPEGTWRVTAREDRGGARLAQALVTVTAGQPVTLNLTPGAEADPGALPETAMPACLDTHRSHGCVVQAVTPLEMVRHLGLNGRSAGEHLAPRYTGTWQTHGGMMALVQDGRRVWGEVHVNGGIGLVWGHVAPDGLTLRGAMDRSSSPRGAVELRLFPAPDAGWDHATDTLSGRWDQNIGRLSQTVTARRLSGGVPPLARATGTEDDLRLTMQGQPWAPADSADFAAFMDPALAPASPDTGEDIDAMQAAADAPNFSGIWASNQQDLQLQQDGRRVWGQRRGGSLWGEVSADGRLMRGVWDNGGGNWGLWEMVLDAQATAIAGRWGRRLDTALGAGDWGGPRRVWLAGPLDPVTPRADASGPDFDAFMAPVRDPDLPQATPAGAPLGDRTDAGPGLGGGALPDLIPAGLAGFAPAERFDYTHPDGTPAASFVFSAPVPGGAYGDYAQGFAWLHPGWCGPGCAAEILPLGGPSLDEVPNPNVRLDRGGAFPALDLSAQGSLAFDADASDWRNVVLRIHVLSDPFSESAPLAPRVIRSFGPFAGGAVRPATLDGWPVADAAPTPAQVQAPPIGAIDALPERGIFVAMADSPREPLDQAFDRLFDPQRTGPGSQMREQCRTEPVAIHPDGLMAERRVDAAAPSGYSTHRYQVCEQAGPLAFCRVFLRDLTPAPAAPDFDYRAEVIGGPHGSFALRDPDTGRSMLYRDCRGPMGLMDGVPASVQDAILMREDQGQAAAKPDSTAPTAPAPQPASAPAAASPIPPGLWHAQAPWSDPMPPRGTPAFADRCHDEVSATFPDGLTIGFEYQETASGPEYFAIWAETCTPSGDATWPFACTADDANVAGAATTQSRLRIDAVRADRVDLTLSTEYEPGPNPFVLHACHGPGGIDLTGDPRGRALVRALAGARGDGGPGLDLAALTTAAPTPAAAAPSGTDPRADLAGLWFPLRGQSRAAMSPDQMALACFETPGRFHSDGLFMAFTTLNDLPVVDNHLRCGADLSCAFIRGGPAQGRPSEGTARLTPRGPDEFEVCLGPQCLSLGRCPAPQWSARERASGLADQWEAAVEGRD